VTTVIPAGISPSEALVLQALLAHAHPIAPGSSVRECSAPLKTLAASAGMSVSAFKVVLRDVEQDRLVATQHRYDAGKPSVYRIDIQTLKEFKPAMNRRKFDRLLAAQNTIAKKIFACIPIAQAWPRHVVQAEMARAGVTCRQQVFDGVLSNLADCGLIRESPIGHFQQVAVREFEREFEREEAANETHESGDEPAIATTPTENDMPKSAAAPADTNDVKSPDPVTRLGNLASQLRELADEIEEAALDAQQLVEAAGAESKKLQSLRALLKDI
jgi:hypothetical protein